MPFRLVVVLVVSLLATLTPTLALARTLQSNSRPHSLSPASLQAIHKALHQQIHVKQTGKALKATAAVQPPATLRPLSGSLPAYNNIGISDATTRALANFDTASRSYSAQALQDVGLYPGITVTSQNISYLWPSVPTGQPDNYAAAGQVIPVTATTGAATVGVLGASTSGTSSGTATLTYTDGTTTTFTLTLTDWWSGTPASGNQQVVHMTTINTKHGTKTGNFYLYSVTTSLNIGKTLQSVTLPATASPGVLHVFAVGVGGPAYNNIGISDDSSPSSGNFDGGGRSYSAQALASVDLVPGQQFDQDGIAYTWPTAASGSVDNYQASGQVLPIIPVPGATTLGLLGASTHGGTSGSSGTATLTFTDSTTQSFTLGFTDWAQTTLLFGNQLAASMTYRNTSTGQQTGTYSLFVAEVAIPSGKTLQSVTLPSTVSSGTALDVFAIGTRATLNNLGSSNDSTSGAGDLDGSNNSYSVQALAAAGLKPGQLVIFNGVSFTWPASYGQLADNDQAAGQVLPLTPVANATSLGFLGSATNGGTTGASGTATITYTDASTQTFTLGFTDWGKTTLVFGNQIVATMSYRNTKSGTQTGTFSLFYTEVALQAGKTMQSVTLPTSVSNGQIHLFAVGTRSAYNNTGISDNSNPAGANFDGNGNSYSAQDFADPTIAGWNPGDTLTYEGINYIWPGVPAGQGDNYQAAGQVIPISAPAGATTLGLVGAASNAFPSASGTATLTYTDNSTATFTLSYADWSMDSGTATPPAGNRLFALLPDYNTLQGTLAIAHYLFEMETPLNASKTLRSVTLPSSVSGGQLHVFMLGTRTGENYPNNIGTSDDSDTLFANFDGSGNSYSIEALEGQGLNEGQPFSFNGVSFTWPASYSVIPDNYQAGGQIIPVTPVSGATTLAFLGSATNGPSSGTATITYTDASTQTFTLGFADWNLASTTALPFRNQVAASMTYRNTPTGAQTINTSVFYISVPLQAGKTLQSVTLPSTVTQGHLHVFALGTKVGGDSTVVASDTTTYQLRNDGSIWQYTGTPMTGWTQLGNTATTTAIAVSGNDHLYQLRSDGSIWQYTGTPLTGWTELDNNPATIEIVASNSTLYQFHNDGSIWQYTGPPLTGWTKLDNNTRAVQVAVDANNDLYQLHNDGTTWKYTGPPLTGWTQLGGTSSALAIAASNTHVYQLRSDNSLWQWTGTVWQQLSNASTTPIAFSVSSNDTLDQLHSDGTIWQYTGTPLTGWSAIGNSPATMDIAVNSSTLYQVRSDGTLWQYTGTPLTGWQQIA